MATVAVSPDLDQSYLLDLFGTTISNTAGCGLTLIT